MMQQSSPAVAGVPFVHKAPFPLELTPRPGITWLGTSEASSPIVIEHRVGDTDVAGFEPLFDAWEGQRYYRDRDGRLVFGSEFHGGRPRHLLIAADERGRFESRFASAPAGPVAFWPRERVSFTLALPARGIGIVAHACGFLLPNGAGVLCPGISGAGKSTLARTLTAAGSLRVLSDDRIALTAEGAGYRMWGTPWPGDAMIADAGDGLLRALVFPARAAAPRLRALPASDALRRMLVTVTLPIWDPGAMDDSLGLVDRLVTSAPAFEFGYPPGIESGGWLARHLPGAIEGG